MRQLSRAGLLLLCVLALIPNASGQTVSYPYYLKFFAGTLPPSDGSAALSVHLTRPIVSVVDRAGNIYILDASDETIRKVTADGRINTVASVPLFPSDMKVGSDGNFYVTGDGRVLKVSPSGVASTVAGIGFGTGSGALSTALGGVLGVALDSAGNIYFTDVNPPGGGELVRMVTTDGAIRTIAGTASPNYSGDNLPATSATLCPTGIALDRSGNIYIADTCRCRIRKFAVGGNITTFAGNGTCGVPADGPATGQIGYVSGLWVDGSNNVFASGNLGDNANYLPYGAILKITPNGTMTRIAGTLTPRDMTGAGRATDVTLLAPLGVSVDGSGSVLVADSSHRVMKVTPDGNLTTVAGALHFAGDGGPAVSALLDTPMSVAADRQGNVFIADAANYRVRNVTPDGLIHTFAGNGLPTGSGSVPFIRSIATDTHGGMYFASTLQAYKATPTGITAIAGILWDYDHGLSTEHDTGDGGPAKAATFWSIYAMAVDASGNVYLADYGANRVRMIDTSGIIHSFAGSGSLGSAGDNGPATQATLSYPQALAVDSKGNVYIGDASNRIRKVSGGIITTVAGNGSLGTPPDGAMAKTSPLPGLPASLGFDDADNLYVSCQNTGAIYRISGGVIRKVVGGGPGSPADGIPALSTSVFSPRISVNGAGDVYTADLTNRAVFKFVVNSPQSFVVADGDQQTGLTGQSLPRPLKVQLTGRAGVGLAGVTVNFAVTSGDATLTASSAQTDTSGMVSVGLTLGKAGTVAVAATAAGISLPPVQFTAVALQPCGVPLPVVNSARSAGEFGASPIFAPGSWLEIKGSNLAQSTRLWTGADFVGTRAPSVLDGVSVTINGKPAFVEYVSPGQVNVQAPADTASGSVAIAVTTASSIACTSAALITQEAAIAPGVLAPGSFNIAGKQYLAALFPDGATFAGNANLIPGVPFRPAAPGDVLTTYGIGFGEVSPPSPPGSVVTTTNSLPNLSIRVGALQASVAYGGLAPGAVGEYEFSFTVPDLPDGDYPVSFRTGNIVNSQTVYLTVHK